MQYSIRQIPTAWLVLTIALTAVSAALLFGFSARASAEGEGVEEVAATAAALVEEGLPSGEATPPPAPEAAPEPAEPDATTTAEPASVTAESEPQPIPSATPPATPTAPSTRDLPISIPDPRAVGTGGATDLLKTAGATELSKDVAGVPSADRISDLARTVRQAPAAAATTVAHATTGTVGGADRMVHEVLRNVTPNPTASESLENLLPAVGGPSEVNAPSLSPVAAAEPGTPAAGLRTGRQAEDGSSLSMPRFVELGDVEPLWSVAPSAPEDVPPGRMRPAWGGAMAAPPDAVGERLSSPAPLDRDRKDAPEQPPGSPQSGASGAGGISFVPLAALLALLALAAPAILRRLGEGPDFWPQTPFVCALERPG